MDNFKRDFVLTALGYDEPEQKYMQGTWSCIVGFVMLVVSGYCLSLSASANNEMAAISAIALSVMGFVWSLIHLRYGSGIRAEDWQPRGVPAAMLKDVLTVPMLVVWVVLSVLERVAPYSTRLVFEYFKNEK